MNDLVRTYVKLLIEDSSACAYEGIVIKSLRRAGAIGTIRNAACNDSTVPDADINIDGDIFFVEVKSNGYAQMGGGSISYSLTDKTFRATGKDIDLSNMLAEALNQMDDTSLHKGIAALLKYLSKESGKKFTSLPVAGFNPAAWIKAVDAGLLLPINRTFSSTIDTIGNHYAKKNTFYIQIGGKGFFRFGKANPANLHVPELSGRVRLELRVAKAGKPTAGLRVQARLLCDKTSPFTLDDPESIKQMLSNV